MVEQNDLSELNKLKLNELIQKFEKCFTMKGYKPNSTFNSKVWFLKDDQSFQSLVQNKTPYSSTPKPNNKIIDLILDLNPGMDIKNLNVPVDKFIYRLSKMIIDSNISIQISDASIKKKRLTTKN